MPSNLMTRAYVDSIDSTKAPTASPTFTGTVTLPASTAITTPVIGAPTGTGFPQVQTVAFTEDATSTTHTGSVVLPAGATLHDIRIMSTVLWGGGTAVMDVGDDDDPDGWFTQVNVKATDLLVGEVLDISNAENWGGKQGAYMVAATGRKGSVAAGVSGTYYGVTKTITGVITVGTPASTAGRTFMTVIFSVGKATAATPA